MFFIKIHSITRLHQQGKVARSAFAQENLKCVTSPTSVVCSLFGTLFPMLKSVYELDLGGHRLFTLLLRSIGVFKAISHIYGSKSGPNRMRRTDERTDERTNERADAHQNFEASYTKALRANIPLRHEHIDQ